MSSSTKQPKKLYSVPPIHYLKPNGVFKKVFNWEAPLRGPIRLLLCSERFLEFSKAMIMHF